MCLSFNGKRCTMATVTSRSWGHRRRRNWDTEHLLRPPAGRDMRPPTTTRAASRRIWMASACHQLPHPAERTSSAAPRTRLLRDNAERDQGPREVPQPDGKWQVRQYHEQGSQRTQGESWPGRRATRHRWPTASPGVPMANTRKHRQQAQPAAKRSAERLSRYRSERELATFTEDGSVPSWMCAGSRHRPSRPSAQLRHRARSAPPTSGRWRS